MYFNKGGPFLHHNKCLEQDWFGGGFMPIIQLALRLRVIRLDPNSHYSSGSRLNLKKEFCNGEMYEVWISSPASAIVFNFHLILFRNRSTER